MLAVLGIAVCAVGAVLLVKGLYPADLPLTQNPDFIDNVFDNRGVIWAARLLLVSATAVLAFGGLIIVVSTGIRMKNGEWLRRGGPFEVAADPGSRISAASPGHQITAPIARSRPIFDQAWQVSA